ncbi:hypothetical protein [Candidatus Karelsulcia muelleri]|nr:hypothetical protein [Candidatus Karelsulcia muelleri]
MKKKNLIILGIDTSCDDTCAAILNNNTVLSNIVRTNSKNSAKIWWSGP